MLAHQFTVVLAFDVEKDLLMVKLKRRENLTVREEMVNGPTSGDHRP
jgi:hypothetical protein